MNAATEAPTTPPSPSPSSSPSSSPSRLVLSSEPGVHASDGVWWPRSTDLRVELPLLDVAVHERTRARIARLGYERDRWDVAPRKVRSPIGITHIGWFERSAHPDRVLLSLSSYGRLVLTVVAPDTDEATARGLLAAAQGGPGIRQG